MCIYEKALQLSIGKKNFVKEENKESKQEEEEDKNSDSQLPDETVINNIDLGGILNLATEDTLNIRYFSYRVLWNMTCLIFQRIYLEHSLHLVTPTQDLYHNSLGLFPPWCQCCYGFLAWYTYNHPLSISGRESNVAKQQKYYGIGGQKTTSFYGSSTEYENIEIKLLGRYSPQ